jgi:hypothetical protein
MQRNLPEEEKVFWSHLLALVPNRDYPYVEEKFDTIIKRLFPSLSAVQAVKKVTHFSSGEGERPIAAGTREEELRVTAVTLLKDRR